MPPSGQKKTSAAVSAQSWQQDISPFNLVSLSAATMPNHTFRLSYNKDLNAAMILVHIMSNNSLTG